MLFEAAFYGLLWQDWICKMYAIISQGADTSGLFIHSLTKNYCLYFKGRKAAQKKKIQMQELCHKISASFCRSIATIFSRSQSRAVMARDEQAPQVSFIASHQIHTYIAMMTHLNQSFFML